MSYAIDNMKGSIEGFFYNLWNVDVISKKIPEQIPIPSMYFPQPSFLTENRSKFEYDLILTMQVKIFHSDAEQALQKAEEITQRILANKNRIPILNIDGTKTEDVLEFDNVQSNPVDDHSANITLTWRESYEFI